MTPTDVGSPEAQDVDVFIAAPAGPQSRPHHRLETRGLWRLRGRGPSLSYLSFFFPAKWVVRFVLIHVLHTTLEY